MMKTLILSLAAIVLLHGTIATPHGRNLHHEKRDIVVEYVTIPTEVIVWVNQYGSTLRVETKGCVSTKPIETPAEPTLPALPPTVPAAPPVQEPSSAPEAPSAPDPAPAPPASVPPSPPVQEPSSAPEAPLVPAPAPPATPTSAPAPPVEQPHEPPASSATHHQSSSPPHFVDAPNSAPTNKIGISYSPYNGDSTCKTQDQVNSDFDKLTGYPLVRIYGVDCNQITTVTNAAKRHNMKVFAGIYDLNNLPGNLKTLTDATKGDWSSIDTISIGNELVNKGQNPPQDVVNAVNSARGTLRAAGYNGPVVTVDTFNAMIAHPELCKASDYCAANCHAFFDSDMTPDKAGPYVEEQAKLVSNAAGGKPTVITESGWPYGGQANGAAVPSRQNQEAAISSLKQSFPNGGIILFTAFDDKWKQDSRYTFSTERYWGIL